MADTTVAVGGPNAASVTDKPPTLEEVLFSFRTAPLDVETFLSFLKSQHAEESLEFWLEAQYHKQKFDHEDPERKERGFFVKAAPGAADEESRLQAAERIRDAYVAEGASREINISSQQRADTLKNVSDLAEDPASPTVTFDVAQKEIEKLLQTDKFGNFVRERTKHNLSTSEARFRGFLGAICLSLVALFVATVALLDWNRYVTLAALPMVLVGVGKSLEYQTGL